jgi:tetratricopeptide (TPR) repeat protein
MMVGVIGPLKWGLPQARPAQPTVQSSGPVAAQGDVFVRFGAKRPVNDSPQPSDPSWPRLINLGKQAFAKQDYGQAFLAYNEAYKLLQPDEIPLRVDNLNLLALACSKLKHFDEAELSLEYALELCKKDPSSRPMGQLLTLNHLGDLYLNTQRNEMAQEHYHRALKLMGQIKPEVRKALPTSVQSNLVSMEINLQIGLGKLALESGEFGTGIQHLETGYGAALKFNLNRIAPQLKYPLLFTMQHYLAIAHAGQEKYETALSYVDEAQDTLERMDADPAMASPFAKVVMLELKADLLEKIHDYPASQEAREEAEALKSSLQPPDGAAWGD